MKIGISVGDLIYKEDKIPSDKNFMNAVSNMVKEDANSISNFNINFNFYDFIKENIKDFCITHSGYEAITHFIDDDKELSKDVSSLRKQIQNEKNDDLCQKLYGDKYSYGGFESNASISREIKRKLIVLCEEEIKKDIQQNVEKDFDEINLGNFHTDIKLHPNYKKIFIYTEMEYPDDKAKQIISDTFDKIQKQIDEYMKEKDALSVIDPLANKDDNDYER